MLLREGIVFLTRGSSSCTISPLAKIRTILPGAMGPCWAAPFPRPERNDLSEVKRRLPSWEKLRLQVFTPVPRARPALRLINYKERNKCTLFDRQKSFRHASPLGKLPKRSLEMDVLGTTTSSNPRDESPRWGPGPCGKSTEAHRTYTSPHAPEQVQLEIQRGLTGLPRTTHVEATEKEGEATGTLAPGPSLGSKYGVQGTEIPPVPISHPLQNGPLGVNAKDPGLLPTEALDPLCCYFRFTAWQQTILLATGPPALGEEQTFLAEGTPLTWPSPLR